LVGEGLAFEFVVEVEVVFDIGLFTVVEVELVLPALLFETVVVVEDVFATVVEAEFAFMVFAARLALALFVAVSPPQAAPNAARPKSAESAIAFFM
jgi:hypothetical protein